MGLFSDGSKGESPAIRELVEAARKRLKENPADAGAVLKLADALAGSDRKTEAVRVLNHYGPIVQSRGRVETAIAIYKKASQLDPDCSLTSSTYLSHLQLMKIMEAERAIQASAPPAPAPPPSGSFTRPGPDPLPPPSGSFELPVPPAGPPSSGFPHQAVPLGPPPSGSFERPPADAAPPPSDSFPAPEPGPPASAWSQKKEAVHGAQAGIPLLRDIPPFLLDLVLQRINLITLDPGEILFREGSEGNSVFFVVQGTLAVTARHDLGTEVVLKTLRDGDAIGESSFLTGLPRHATVTAREQSNLLELDRNALTPIARKHRPLAEALNRLYVERILTSALARSRVFGVLPEPVLRQLTQKLGTIAVQAGTAVVQQGTSVKFAYIVKQGAFRVAFRAGDREVAVALLRPHEVFGDLGEERGQPQAESVTAVTDSELLCLASEDLAALRARSPQLVAALDALKLERAESCVAALRGARR
jgi:CRP-like cAMP-binding protein